MGHEAEHARGVLTHTNDSLCGDGTSYDRPEERRVIDEHETPTAKQLGEGTRKNHRGEGYPVKCSVCR